MGMKNNKNRKEERRQAAAERLRIFHVKVDEAVKDPDSPHWEDRSVAKEATYRLSRGLKTHNIEKRMDAINEASRPGQRLSPKDEGRMTGLAKALKERKAEKAKKKAEQAEVDEALQAQVT